MYLDRVTITGIDDHVDASFIDEMTSGFDFLEWGILLSSSLKGQPRYPSDRWLADLTTALAGKFNSFSAHLCGSLCEKLITDAGGTYITGELIENSVPTFFDRLQLNNYPDKHYRTDQINTLASILLHRLEIGVVLPIPNERILDRVRTTFLSNVGFLHDRSRGRGVVPDEWPQAELRGYVGFAGGIDEQNARQILDTLCSRLDERPFWIDMESGVRTDDCLDTKKVEVVLKIAGDYIGH